MEIILIQDVNKLGQKDDIVNVKDGYGRNYLIPRGYAVAATTSVKKMHAENLRQRAHKEEKIKIAAQEIAGKLEGVKITVGAKTSTSGKIFGSVNTIQIAESLKEKGFDIDRKNITLPLDQIKEVGNYKAVIKLHREVKVEIDFEIIGE
ncbi:MAG: 50S ribosomal protein L9 [Bacteroidetes bacterium GWE2_41_25]|nr:MAG: 50S ribosomal protein L9 [Bacteroidetes bacterium GWA2_40_15]OFY02003.1 MAG: 50S ribosomal protein L9 [Bacteroidetes bacterium GWE2_41_25]OFY58428.1 MAG: 50S ribosomal protein L9 [Bacteroidetes bacterium GWF2_41_9]HBQ83409.1 50S ribosomal protein L9 [Bacteroidales bacterium]HCU20009.1 50S ribosomal protein L9 [Bacteroidales bacterium]